MEAIYTTLDILYTLTAIFGLTYLTLEFVFGLMARPRAFVDSKTHPEGWGDWELPPPQLHPDPVFDSPAKSVGAMARDYSKLGVRQLRLECRDRGFKGAARFTKAQCLEALATQ